MLRRGLEAVKRSGLIQRFQLIGPMGHAALVGREAREQGRLYGEARVQSAKGANKTKRQKWKSRRSTPAFNLPWQEGEESEVAIRNTYFPDTLSARQMKMPVPDG